MTYSVNAEGVIRAHTNRTDFQYAEVVAFLTQALSRKEVKNGVLTHLCRSLKQNEEVLYKRRFVALHIVRQAPDQYRISCTGAYQSVYLDRAVRTKAQTEARVAYRAFTEHERHRQHSGKKSTNRLYMRPGVHKLTRHYRGSALLWETAVSIVSYAVRLPQHIVERALRDSWYLNPHDTAGVIRLRGGFVIRIDTALPEEHSFVELRSTKNNHHGVYRRLRRRSKKLLRGNTKKQRLAPQGQLRYVVR